MLFSYFVVFVFLFPLAQERSMHIEVLENIHKLNDDVAAQNRALLQSHRIFSINLMGGPGCGKTTLVEATCRALAPTTRIAVIVGDLATPRDAQRIAAFCPHVIQINTGKGCHLEAHQVRQALSRIPLADIDFLIIENVGNLVCPVGFDLGQSAKIGMFALTEGPDKPAKYPHMVTATDLLLLNKVDLLPHVPFPLDDFRADIKLLAPQSTLLEIACLPGRENPAFTAWLTYLRSHITRR